MKIIYKNESGGVSVLHPTEEALSFMSIDEIAKKDVPTGLPYKIVEDDYLPTDRTFRDAWEIEEETITDGFGADYGIGSDNILIGYDENRDPITMTVQEYIEQRGSNS